MQQTKASRDRGRWSDVKDSNQGEKQEVTRPLDNISPCVCRIPEARGISLEMGVLPSQSPHGGGTDCQADRVRYERSTCSGLLVRGTDNHWEPQTSCNLEIDSVGIC